MTTAGEHWLITGAGGFIGRRLVDALVAQEVPVTGWRRADADLADADAVARAMAGVAPTHIVHLAAGPSAPDGADWSAIAREVAMVGALAAAMPADCRLLHAGSMAEFGQSGRFDEGVICRPRSPYGFAKAAATDHALALRVATGRRIGVARLFGVYGPGEAAGRLIPHLVRELSAGRRVPLSAGDQIRDFVHVDDVCASVIAIARADDATPLLHIGTGIGVSVRQVCETVAEVLGTDRALLGFGDQPYRAVDEAELVADPAALSRVADVPPQRWLSLDAIATYVRAEAGRLVEDRSSEYRLG